MSNSHKCSSSEPSLSYANSAWAEEIRTIKKRLRLAMDGVVSSSLRERGMNDYRIIFGCSMQSLKRIAQNTPHEAELADYLWQENIRESKILATMIHPIEAFDLEKARLWSIQTPHIEIAEQLAMNLFCHAHFAIDIAIEWLQQNDRQLQTVALLTLQRIAITQNKRIGINKQRLIGHLLIAQNLYLTPIVGTLYLNLWKRLLRITPETNETMLQTIQQNESIEALQKRQLLEALQIELQYI